MTSEQTWTVTFCPQCGLDVKIDEDGVARKHCALLAERGREDAE